MKTEELRELLDIETGADFTYFENFTALMESDGDFDSDTVRSVLAEVDMKVFSELADSYFYDLTENVPENGIDVYNALEAAHKNFVSLAASFSSDDSVPEKMASDIVKFRRWFMKPDLAESIDNESGKDVMMSVRDALYEYRASRVDGRDLDFEFFITDDFPIDEYVVNVGEMTGTEDEQSDDAAPAGQKIHGIDITSGGDAAPADFEGGFLIETADDIRGESRDDDSVGDGSGGTGTEEN
jgi:hypothetical protein